ncbi:hypothetical protein PR048_001587 [Dryococelus australis]|uniref:Uncharacterized protein n=1 Tax=Dryococelus australis TaxID=614101 RepID=A0ABQ9IJ61_9NEOP|nr:hypothetical protein PR048_001587 [Dryococelus australis]
MTSPSEDVPIPPSENQKEIVGNSNQFSMPNRQPLPGTSRQATGSCRITEITYERELVESLEWSKALIEKSKKNLDKEGKPKRQRHSSIKLSDSEEQQNDPRLDDSDSDLDLIVEKKLPNDEGATCMFCDGRFCDDKGGDEWVMFLCAPCGHTMIAQLKFTHLELYTPFQLKEWAIVRHVVPAGVIPSCYRNQLESLPRPRIFFCLEVFPRNDRLCSLLARHYMPLRSTSLF